MPGQLFMKEQLMFPLVADPPPTGGSSMLLIIGLPVLLIGFMFITQRRRAKAVQAMQSTLAVGDEITTSSGMLGRISALDGQIATLEVGPGVSVRFDRRAIAGPAPTPPASSDSRTDAQSDPTSLND
jgi:preprotein translocase subunit YajC